MRALNGYGRIVFIQNRIQMHLFCQLAAASYSYSCSSICSYSCRIKFSKKSRIGLNRKSSNECDTRRCVSHIRLDISGFRNKGEGKCPWLNFAVLAMHLARWGNVFFSPGRRKYSREAWKIRQTYSGASARRQKRGNKHRKRKAGMNGSSVPEIFLGCRCPPVA